MSYQLKYDYTLNEVYPDIPFWHNEKDIPIFITDYIVKNYQLTELLDEEDNLYCPYCLKVLTNEGECLNCHRTFTKFFNYGCWIDLTKDRLDLKWFDEVTYFVFDVVDSKVVLYLIEAHINCFHNHYETKTYEHFTYHVKASLLVTLTGLYDLATHTFYDWSLVTEKNSKSNAFIRALNNVEGYIYASNLELLKPTLYRYTYLWRAISYLKDFYPINIQNLTYYPLACPSFEHLMKHNLFNLAFLPSPIFTSSKTFKELWPFNRDLLSFITKNNLTWEEIEILKLYPKPDLALIKFYASLVNFSSFSLIKKAHLNLLTLKDYLETHFMPANYYEYLDYLYLVDNLKLDFTNSSIIYPANFNLAHEKLYLDYEISNDPLINQKLEAIASIAKLNSYEDEKYLIYPASSVEELIKESSNQHNCVRSFASKFAQNNCQIYFLRKKSNPTSSFVTIEVQNDKIIQAKTKFNKEPTPEILNLLKRWEQKLIPIINQN